MADICCLVVKKERESTFEVSREIVLCDVAEEFIGDYGEKFCMSGSSV